MNLTAAITELKARGGSFLSDARCTIFLNDAKNDFEDYYDWPWLEATATGTAPVTLTDLKNILYVTDYTRGTELQGVTARDIIAQAGPNIDLTGVPNYWWLNGAYILEVFPKNTTDTLKIRYTSFTAELSGTDTPAIPPRHHNIWIDLAMVRVYKDSDNLAAAERLEVTAYQRLAKLVEVFEYRNHQNALVQQVTSGSADW